MQWIQIDGHIWDLKRLVLPSSFSHHKLNTSAIHHSSDCSLRFPQNITFEPNTETKTIKEFYAHYLKRSDKALVLSDHKKLAKGTSLALEVFINEAAVSTVSFIHPNCSLTLNSSTMHVLTRVLMVTRMSY
jgi:hypothetical protein